MNDVNINGVRYVPLTDKPNALHVNRLGKILAKECPYLSRTEISRVVKVFENGDTPKPSSKPKTEKPQKSATKGKLFNYGNFKGFDDDGHIIHKRGKPTSWTIKNAIDIQQWIRNGKVDKDRVKKLSSKYDIPVNTVNDIIYNLNNGSLQLWVNMWQEKQIKGKKVPIENNPQKRKECGWYE